MSADLLLLVLLLAAVPVAVITTVIVASLATANRKQPSPAGLGDLAGRQALAAAWQAHARLAVLEDRIRDLERQVAVARRRGGAA